MTVEFGTIFAYGLGIVLLYLFGRLFVAPAKALVKLVYNLAIGTVVLVLINLAGGLFDFKIALNIISAAVVGFLGLPGVILLILLKSIYKI